MVPHDILLVEIVQNDESGRTSLFIPHNKLTYAPVEVIACSYTGYLSGLLNWWFSLKKRISFCERNCFNYSCNKNSKASAFSTPCPISILSDPHVIRWLHLTMKPNLMTFKTTSTWWQKKRDDIGLVAWWKMHHQRVMMTGCPKESREKAFFPPPSGEGYWAAELNCCSLRRKWAWSL